MILYFLVTFTCTMSLCFLTYRFFGQQIQGLTLKLDDGRGYYLVCIMLITFFGSALSYYAGCVLEYDQNAAQLSNLGAVIMLNTLAALGALTYGLMHFKEGERY